MSDHCSYYKPCSVARSLEKRGEEDRGRRDQQITVLEKQRDELVRVLNRLVTKYGVNDDGTEKDWHEYVDARAVLTKTRR